MALQFSVAVRNARLEAIEATIGASAVLKIYSGAVPANCAAARTGTLLASMALPADWMSNAASGAKSLLGLWQDSTADATGTAGNWCICDSGGATVGIQGTITATGGGGDIELSSVAIVAGQSITITAETITEGNA